MPAPNASARVDAASAMDPLIDTFRALTDPATAHQLRHAVAALSARGLVQSAVWAAEMLAALPSAASTSAGSSAPSSAAAATPCPTCLSESTTAQTPQSIAVTLAKGYFDTRQYRRVAAVLKDERASLPVFLRLYATYLAGERRKEEERMELSDCDAQNHELDSLRHELRSLLEADRSDPHLWYLYGVVLKRQKQASSAVSALVQSLAQFPYNRGAWLELAPLCETRRDAEGLKLPSHWMRTVFIASILNETEGSAQARDIFEAFVTAAPQSRFAKLQLSISLYHMRLFDEAQALFDEIYAADDYCLDGVDIYSNILYVKEDKVQLSLLANKCVKIDKFRLETCCVIGNYYSLRGQHDQALAYFQRALKINRNYLSAWTLMGHEFLEMKNTSAAVEAYRRAVDINPKDFRAWYGLGQTYELLNMPMYTLYYYQKAAALRPQDARMWCAAGKTLLDLHKFDEAIRCYERAVGCDDREGLALSKLAYLYDRLAREAQRDGRQHERAELCAERAAKYYEANLARRDEDKLGGQETADALRYLAEHWYTKGDLTKASEYGRRLLDFPGHDKDFVKTLLRQMHSSGDGGNADAS